MSTKLYFLLGIERLSCVILTNLRIHLLPAMLPNTYVRLLRWAALPNVIVRLWAALPNVILKPMMEQSAFNLSSGKFKLFVIVKKKEKNCLSLKNIFKCGRTILKVQFSRYNGNLKSRLVRILNGQKEIGLQMVQIKNEIWNLEVQPFEIQTNGCHFVQKHLKPWQKCPDFK